MSEGNGFRSHDPNLGKAVPPVFTYPPPRKVERPAEPRPVGDAEVGRSIVGYPAPGSHSVLVRRPPKEGKPINTKCQTVHKLSTIRTPNRLRCIGPCARQFYPQTRSLTGILPSSGRIASVPRAFLWYIRAPPPAESRDRNCCAPQVHASSLKTAAAKQANSTTYGLGFVFAPANTARPPYTARKMRTAAEPPRMTTLAKFGTSGSPAHVLTLRINVEHAAPTSPNPRRPVIRTKERDSVFNNHRTAVPYAQISAEVLASWYNINLRRDSAC